MVRMRCREEPAPIGEHMGECIVSLRGWHPALAQAELSALFPDGQVEVLASPRLARLTCPENAPELSISSGIEAIFSNGTNMDWSEEDVLLKHIEKHLKNYLNDGSTCAVYAWKHGEGIEGCSRTKLAGKVGGILSRMGASIDLENPESTFGILLDGLAQTVTFGWLKHGLKGDSSIERRATQRPFFKPVSLEPRLARLAVNLACGPLAAGACVDPMTGTGGFTIEAILSGRNAIGIDLDEEMIQGAKKNLEWAGSQLNPFIRGDATNIKGSLPDTETISFAGVVLDPPYGRNSHGSMDHHDLLQKTLESTREVVDGGLVLILPSEPRSDLLNHPLAMDERPSLKHYAWETIEMMLTKTGWHYQNAWYVSVHGSLGRVIVLATTAPQD